ncbi:hypothetical protein MMAGJ_32730 [Mycolicibacterium mageritense]|uniref:DUF222 domain-containing protein n=3 Tax=Mycolicibacterium mageritense TaxID=53462 RepID=A0ABM7HTW3_MYCME|nr:hypothetical protein MMAGJ_32730 [Mycolicibacterium mageritense]CDO22410.1 hypothetical protein BN978_02885 [Mycolicibacterium mageritense DSM 44476 = CIP 104973]
MSGIPFRIKIEHMFEDNASWELALCIGESVADEAMMMAWRMSMIGELLNRHIAEVEAEDDDPGFVLVTAFARTVAEVGAAMHLSPSVVSQAESLTNRLPQVAEVVGRGMIRNLMRASLVLFKGDELSSSPYARWINEPPEPDKPPF